MNTIAELRRELAEVQKKLSDVAHDSYLIPKQFRAEFRREVSAAQMEVSDAITTLDDGWGPDDPLEVIDN